MINRRDLLKASAIPLLANFADPILAATSAAPDAPGAIPWQRQLRRCGQLNMTEHDPVTLDIEQWAAARRSFGIADAQIHGELLGLIAEAFA